MKRFLVLTLVLSASIGIFAQEKIIQKEEFDSVDIKGRAKYDDKSYRIIRSHEFGKSIHEFALPNSSRTIVQSNSPFGNSKTETITIDGITYMQINDEGWKVYKADSKAQPKNITLAVDRRIEYKYLGKQMLGNQNTSVYQTVEREKATLPNTKREMISTYTSKYWYGEDGAILKQESDREYLSNPDKKDSIVHQVSTTIWEIDSKIKIERPKLN